MLLVLIVLQLHNENPLLTLQPTLLWLVFHQLPLSLHRNPLTPPTSLTRKAKTEYGLRLVCFLLQNTVRTAQTIAMRAQARYKLSLLTRGDV